MPFMVIYRTADAETTYQQAEAIDEAALFVERLRNSEGIDQIRIYRMEEISFAFRPYYKVELGMPERQSTQRPAAADRLPPMPETPAASPEAPTSTVVDARSESDAVSGAAAHLTGAPDADPTDAAVAEANGRRGLFGR